MPESRVTIDRDGYPLLIGLNRTDKRNAADLQLLQEPTLAYGGLDLADVGPRLTGAGLDLVPRAASLGDDRRIHRKVTIPPE